MHYLACAMDNAQHCYVHIAHIVVHGAPAIAMAQLIHAHVSHVSHYVIHILEWLFLLPNYRVNILKESFPSPSTKQCSPVTCLHPRWFSQPVMHSQDWHVDRGHLSPFYSAHLLCWRTHPWISSCKEVFLKAVTLFCSLFLLKGFFFHLPA